MSRYDTENQRKNLAWFLPRPKPDHYKGGMPLGCEDWLIELAKDIICDKDREKNFKILNLFCGMNKHGVRVDLNPEVKPDYLLDAHLCSKELLEKEGKFDLIIADPPYSNKEAKEIYSEVKLPKLSYELWTYECDKLLKVGGILIIYHKYLMPNPNWGAFEVAKRVFIGTRTYHLPRVAIYFKKIA
ncbi:MAG TPA: hypothetical protein ENH82_02065 [bacterium]|nr:hypothetical protein [bacterium]